MFVAKTWNFFTCLIITVSIVFLFADFLLWLQSGWQNIVKVLLLEGLVILILLLILFGMVSEKVLLGKDGITHVYRSIFLYKFHKLTVEWKDIRRIEGEFGRFHMGERITLFLSRNRSSTFSFFKERDRMTLTNVIRNFQDLVFEIIKRAPAATKDKSIK